MGGDVPVLVESLISDRGKTNLQRRRRSSRTSHHHSHWALSHFIDGAALTQIIESIDFGASGRWAKSVACRLKSYQIFCQSPWSIAFGGGDSGIVTIGHQRISAGADP